MNQHQFVTVTRTLVKRGLSDIERKVTAMFVSGAAGYAALSILNAYGVVIPPNVAELVPLASGLIGGWMTHSLGATTTFHTDDSGHLTEVSTATGSIKIPVQAIPQPRPVNPVPPIPVEPDPAPLEVPDQAPAASVVDQSTAIISPVDRYEGILSRLPSATGPVDSVDGH